MRKIKWILLLSVMLLLCGCQKDSGEKKVVTLDIGEPSPQMQEAIDRFNAGNDTYCIEVVDNTGVSDVISVRAAKLTAGDGPDIFAAGADTHFQEFVEKGVLEDLKPYIEADLKEEEYLTELLYAYESDGKVYAIETEFQIIGMIGAKEIFGDMTGWTPQEAIAMMEAYSEIGRFENAEPLDVLRDFWLFGGMDITDYGMLRECILFAEKYGKPLENGEEEVLGGNVLVARGNLKTPLSLANYASLYDTEICFIGFPRADRNGFMTGNGGLSINAASPNKEGAWAFLRFLLEEEYQSGLEYSFSVRKDVFEQRLAEYSVAPTFELYIPETGETVTVETTYFSTNGKEIKPLTEEETAYLEKLARSCISTSGEVNYGAWEIIYEEAGAYFSDDRSIDEVMDAIENRVELWMKESD